MGSHCKRPVRLYLRRAVWLTGSLLLTSCSVPWAHDPLSASSSTSAGATHVAEVSLAGQLLAAQNLVFANQYAQAGRTYAALARSSPTEPEVHAAYALFLSYDHQTAPAAAEATMATRMGPSDGRAFAVLCRIDDWGARVTEAVAAGTTAVALAPNDALAHLFLSEAVADHGDAARARLELARASALLSDRSSSYERAELSRERSNLAHDTGDTAGQVDGLLVARTVQPGWVERASELAQAYLDQGNLDAAHTTLQDAVSIAPNEPGPLQTLAAVSLIEGDYATATTVLRRAQVVAPKDGSLLDLVGQLDMATAHDPAAARRDLLAALTVNPGDVQAAAYVLALARYVTGDEAQAKAQIALAIHAGSISPSGRPAAPPNPDANQTLDQNTALRLVNAARSSAGLGPVQLDARLSASAAAHCYYWLFNNASTSVAKLGIHNEDPALAGFRGVRPWDRALAAGYPNGRIGEDITHRGNPEGAVNDWVNSVFHRFPILRPDLQFIGYADCAVGPLPMEDMEFGFAAAGHFDPVAFPAAGQTAVPVSFVDNELPDPIPAGSPRTSGYPVTVTFAPGVGVTVQSFTLSDPSGAVLPAYLLPTSAESENSVSLLTRTALVINTAYRAHLVAMVSGKPYDVTWSFTTG